MDANDIAKNTYEANVEMEIEIVDDEPKIISTKSMIEVPFEIEQPIPIPNNDNSMNTKPVYEETSLEELGYVPQIATTLRDLQLPRKLPIIGRLKHIIENRINTNLEIHIGRSVFRCHMLPLQIYSKVFSSCQNELLIQLPIEHISPLAFDTIYEWMLCDRPLIPRENIMDILKGAIFLKVNDMVSQILKIIASDIFSEDAAFTLHLEARNANIPFIESFMLRRISKFFLTLVSTKEFLDLTLPELNMLLSSNDIGVNAEIEVFLAAVRWINYNFNERKAVRIEVMNNIRFGLMPFLYLTHLSSNLLSHELDSIIKVDEIQSFINDGLTYRTISQCCGDNTTHFCKNILHEDEKNIKPRQWIYDSNCKYHQRSNCDYLLTYAEFNIYLGYLQVMGPDYYKTLEILPVNNKNGPYILKQEDSERTDASESLESDINGMTTECSISSQQTSTDEVILSTNEESDIYTSSSLNSLETNLKFDEYKKSSD